MLAYKVVWLKPQRKDSGTIEVSINPPLPLIAQHNELKIMPNRQLACPSLKQYMRADYQQGTLSLCLMR